MERITHLLECIKIDLKVPGETISSLLTHDEEKKILEGEDAILKHILLMISHTKSSILIFSPQIREEILQSVSQNAYERKGARFLWITKVNFEKYYSTIRKMLALGNAQFRNSEKSYNYYCCIRDGKELIIGNHLDDSNESISIIYKQVDIVKKLGPKFFSFFRSISSPILSERGKIARAKIIKKLKKKLEKIQDSEKREKLLKKKGVMEVELIDD